MNGILRADAENGTVNVQMEDGLSIKLEDCWLRDHCRCTNCYRSDTYQRIHHLLEIPEAFINNLDYDQEKIRVTWSDGHESLYSANFLAEFHYKTWIEGRSLKPIVWQGASVSNKVCNVDVDSFLNSVDGARKVFQSLLDYGVAFISNVEVSEQATEKVCQALGGVQHTLFGGMWKVSTVREHADTAYTTVPLAVHNDNTYFTEAAGLQIFHCMEHENGAGGETVLLDGFHGALQLKRDHPEDFEFLTHFDLEAEYLEDGYHHSYSAPVISLDKFNDIKQIRFNVYDRSPMAFASGAECRSYYRALRNLSRYYEDKRNQWCFKLMPGTLLVFDNFRVLHGRAGFTGHRVLSGSYVSRSDWLSRARVLRLIK
ncbi:trimethyllysine dioxygenase, mitochondrial isoform X2 [Aricia agestis]|uniref:trimethyllysine dioxygenase, mitochondrial isoform X2 n=1 Tax=Aricia agestis TaxID=91739 RepID=UPI001C20912F|nr:trimethyllysine dioxygenase, mitochondrial isoform X2 [Aricia agestis]